MSTTFCFGGIYRDKVPLCTASLENGMWDKYYSNMFEKNQISVGLNCVLNDGYILGTLRDNDQPIYFLVGRNIDQKTMEESLTQLKGRFVGKNFNWKTAEPNSLTVVFGPEFRQFLETRAKFGKANNVMTNINETIDKMNDNLLQMTDRGAMLDDMESISTDFVEHIDAYNWESKKVKCKLFFEKYRMYIIGALIGIFVLYMILVLACGGFDLKPRCIVPVPKPTPTPKVDPELDPFI